MRPIVWVLGLVLAGTAPARAATWLAGEMADAGPRPRTLAQPERRAQLQERVSREPYTTLLRRMVGLAARDVDLEATDRYAELRKASTARAAAWLVWLDRTLDEAGAVVPFPTEAARRELGTRAVELMRTMRTTSRAKGLVGSVEDIFTAQDLHCWADTFDLLAASGMLAGARAELAQALADLTADFFADFELENWLYTRSLVNNHRSKSAAAVGLAAISLNGEVWEAPAADGRYEPERWVDFALQYVDFTIRDALTDADGGFQEGGGYITYSGIDHLPFLWAWNRYTGAASRTITWHQDTAPFLVVGQTEPYEVPDMWSDEVLARQLLWAIRTQAPDGSFLPFDDSTPGARLFWGAFVSGDFEHAGLFRWAWELNGLSAGGSVATEPFLVAAFDDAVAPLDPVGSGLARHQILRHAGQAVLRSDWSRTGLHLTLLAEHGKAAGRAQTRWGQIIDGVGGHEHPDPLSIMLYAGGEALIIDSGYLGWGDHEKVWGATHHNLILVDGRGPASPTLLLPPFEAGPDGGIRLTDPTVEGGWKVAPDGEAWLVASDVDTPGLAFAEAVTRYEVDAPSTDLRRRAVRLADRYVVLHDRVVVEAGGEHTFTHLLHVHCGGTGGGSWEPAEHGGTCTRDRAALRILVIGSAPPEQRTRLDVHDEWGWDERTHTVLETEVAGGSGVDLLTVLLVETAEHPGGAQVDFSGVNGDGTVRWADGERTCEARLAPFAAACTQDGVTAGVWHGRVDAPGALVTGRFGEETELIAHYVEPPEQRADLTLAVPAGRAVDGACEDVRGPGAKRVRVPPGVRVRFQADARPLVAHLRLDGMPPGGASVVPLGEPVALDASATCGPAAHEELRFQWSLERQPELSRVSLPGEWTEEPRLTFLPDLPGVYAVRVRAAAVAVEDGFVVELDVVGEPPWPPPSPDVDAGGPADGGVDADSGAPSDADVAAAPEPDPGSGCDCEVAAPAVAPWPLGWRR